MNKTYLAETDFINFSHPAILELSKKVRGENLKQKAVSIYYLVRDSIRYNPYTVESGTPSFKASFAAENNEAYCIPKAALMVALCRLHKIPAKIGFADVRNHLSSEKFIALIGTNYFAMHGYAEILLEDQWIKATPIFNATLCEKFQVEPLEFDGESDSIFQKYTTSGKKHMEYIVDHGSFDDVPVDFIYAGFKKHYPKLMGNFIKLHGHSLEDDIALE